MLYEVITNERIESDDDADADDVPLTTDEQAKANKKGKEIVDTVFAPTVESEKTVRECEQEMNFELV